MKIISLISTFGIILILSSCSQHLPSDNNEQKNKTSTFEQSINQNSGESVSYQDIIDYVDNNITTIIDKSFSKKATNGNWFAVGYGFTSLNHVYVDFEDGHVLYRALLECNDYQDNISSCKTLAIFEKKYSARDNSTWEVSQGNDTQKDNSIIYKWAIDYEWQR